MAVTIKVSGIARATILSAAFDHASSVAIGQPHQPRAEPSRHAGTPVRGKACASYRPQTQQEQRDRKGLSKRGV
jgi:hypothetical protein